MTAAADKLAAHMAQHPRLPMAHVPTPLEKLNNLGAELGLDLWVKRDDCTGVAFGGNKVRQLEYHFGAAQREAADTVLITGAVQSNFVRTAAAMARRLGLDIHIQLEEKVPDMGDLYRENGNVLIDRLFGATLHSYTESEDEAGADRAIGEIAEGLRAEGRRPYIVPLAADHPPLGALGYIDAASELLQQTGESEPFDEVIIASGSAVTHIGVLYGLRALGSRMLVRGICVCRNASLQGSRVMQRLTDLCGLLDYPLDLRVEDVRLYDGALPPGYGRPSEAVTRALGWTAQSEGLLLDPVYTGKVMAGLIDLTHMEELAGRRVLFWHTGGQPALFAYGDVL